jgi:hypothetical protein
MVEVRTHAESPRAAIHPSQAVTPVRTATLPCLLASPSNLRLRCRTFPTSPLPLVTKLANGDPGALPGPRSGPSGLPGEAQGPVARAGADLGDCELDGEGGISADETETELVNRAPVERTVVS